LTVRALSQSRACLLELPSPTGFAATRGDSPSSNRPVFRRTQISSDGNVTPQVRYRNRSPSVTSNSDVARSRKVACHAVLRTHGQVRHEVIGPACIAHFADRISSAIFQAYERCRSMGSTFGSFPSGGYTLKTLAIPNTCVRRSAASCWVGKRSGTDSAAVVPNIVSLPPPAPSRLRSGPRRDAPPVVDRSWITAGKPWGLLRFFRA
jgi:hypothetical protein